MPGGAPRARPLSDCRRGPRRRVTPSAGVSRPTAGEYGKVMVVYVITLASPLILLGLAVLMEQVERPLRRDAVGEQLVMFLESAQPEELEAMVSDGFAPALDRYWARRSPRRGSRDRAAGEPVAAPSMARTSSSPASVQAVHRRTGGDLASHVGAAPAGRAPGGG